MDIRGPGWSPDCPKCAGSKFACDEHFRASVTGGTIPMLCRKCKRAMDLPRSDAPDVPAWVARIEHDQCDQCDDGDRSAEHWLTADGTEPDPETAARTESGK